MIIFAISVLAIMLIFIKFIRKKYNIVPYPKPYRHINNIHKWGERFLILLAIILFILSYIIEWYLIFGFAIASCIANGFRAYMEYKHQREEKEYIITFIETLGISIILVGLPIFYFGWSL